MMAKVKVEHSLKCWEVYGQLLGLVRQGRGLFLPAAASTLAATGCDFIYVLHSVAERPGTVGVPAICVTPVSSPLCSFHAAGVAVITSCGPLGLRKIGFHQLRFVAWVLVGVATVMHTNQQCFWNAPPPFFPVAQ